MNGFAIVCLFIVIAALGLGFSQAVLIKHITDLKAKFEELRGKL